MVNAHHLELFYYVAKFGGLTAAARKMPYGIGQPALSAQLRQLEAQFGTLFQRSPFALTPAGEELYAHVSAFFEKVEALAERRQQEQLRLVRLSGSPLVMRDYLPPILARVAKKFPELNFTLTEAQQPQIDAWLEERQLDLAISILEGRPPKGCRAVSLLELRLVLLVRDDCPARSFREVWQDDQLARSLIRPLDNDPITRCFRKGLARRPRKLTARLTVNSIELVESQVAQGLGVGLSVQIPGRKLPPSICVIPLPDFPTLKVGAVWRGQLTEVTSTFLAEFKEVAQRLKAAARP